MDNHPIVHEFEQSMLRDDLPPMNIGDTVAVKIRVLETTDSKAASNKSKDADGKPKERFQIYEGVVIAKKNRGLNSSVTVRKISHGVGVEQVFLLHSRLVDSYKVTRRGEVRRAKLYYLRQRSGKSARIKEKLG